MPKKETRGGTYKPSPTPIRIPPELKERLKKQAEKEGRSLSNLIIYMLNNFKPS